MLGGRFFKRGPLSRRYHEGSHGKGNVSIQHFGASGAAGSGACAPALTGGNNDRPGEHALPQQPPPDAICGPAVDGLLLQALSRRGRNVRARGRGEGATGGENVPIGAPPVRRHPASVPDISRRRTYVHWHHSGRAGPCLHSRLCRMAPPALVRTWPPTCRRCSPA